MKKVRRNALILACFACLALASCANQSQQALEFIWPGLMDQYVETSDEWTRTETLYDGIDREAEVRVLLKSDAWRRSFTDHWADVYALEPAAKQKFLDDQLAAHKAGTDFVVAVESSKKDLRSLDTRMRNWRVVAIQNGKVFLPVDLRRVNYDAWPPEKLAAFYPHYNRWQKYFLIRFQPLSEGPVRLLVSGPAGRLAFDWEHYK